jgi:carbon monoxide dehydrogenase subunit G
MHLDGTHLFRAPRDQVWQAMLDPEALASCLPGSQGFHALGENRYEAVLVVKVGPVTGTYKSQIHLSDIQPPERYRLGVEGSGGPGALKGTGELVLSDAPDGTLVSYSGDVHVTGTIARVGQRLLPGVAKMMIGRFFECMDERVAMASQVVGGGASDVQGPRTSDEEGSSA